MTFISKLGLITKTILVSLFSAVQTSSNNFVYLNSPETLTSTGILHKKIFKENSNSRYFFHFKNGTNKNQDFSISTKSEVKNMKKSINTNLLPERAGAKTIENFMNSSPKNQKINMITSLKPEETVSGLIEGNFAKNEILIFKFGSTDNLLPSFNIYQNTYNFDFSYSLNAESSIMHKLGDRSDKYIPGQYGQNINITVIPKQSGIMKLSFSPRGGAGLLIFSHRGKIYSTKLMPARNNYDVMMISVEKDKAEKFTFIPVGGLNYPINLDFTLQSILLEDGIA
jgi:hypothetical protein